MLKILSILLSLFPFILFSQINTHVIIKGKIISSTTDEPIPYASIHIQNTQTGTICNDSGKFELPLEHFNPDDTIIISSIGYKQLKTPIIKLNLPFPISFELEDSLFLLNEVVAICFDKVEALRWKSNNSNNSKLLFSFATSEIQNIANFLRIVKEQFGNNARIKPNFIRWKKIKINEIYDKTDVKISWFPCPYCQNIDNVAVTIEVENEKGNNLIEIPDLRKKMIELFQNMINKSIAMGVDNVQLHERDHIMYRIKSEDPYSGLCFEYFDNGQKGVSGAYLNGLKNGLWEYWYSNGVKKIRGNYVSQLKSGLWEYWYPNGKIKNELQYKDNEMDGKCIWYFENGRIKKEAIFKKGIFIEKSEWNEKGKKIENQHSIN
jgi:hypothetical protein